VLLHRRVITGRNDGPLAPLVIHHDQGWKKVLEKNDINWIMPPIASPLSQLLMEGGGWKLIYADRVAHIFVKDTPENAGLIEKYRNARPPDG
jgi:hypothetical protein